MFVAIQMVLKQPKNVIQTIIVDGISDLNRQLSWILRHLLESKLFVTNLLRFTTQNIYSIVTIVNVWQIKANLWKFKILHLGIFHIR